MSHSALTIQDWIFRVRPPTGPAARAVLLAIHGRTGNEGSMEIFIQKLNSVFWVILPARSLRRSRRRIQLGAEERGIHQDFPGLESSAAGLSTGWTRSGVTQEIVDLPFYLLGFSQGAALALTYSLSY